MRFPFALRRLARARGKAAGVEAASAMLESAASTFQDSAPASTCFPAGGPATGRRTDRGAPVDPMVDSSRVHGAIGNGRPVGRLVARGGDQAQAAEKTPASSWWRDPGFQAR